MYQCLCKGGSKPGEPARCQNSTANATGYCDECTYRCCSLQRHNINHPPEKPVGEPGWFLEQES